MKKLFITLLCLTVLYGSNIYSQNLQAIEKWVWQPAITLKEDGILTSMFKGGSSVDNIIYLSPQNNYALILIDKSESAYFKNSKTNNGSIYYQTDYQIIVADVKNEKQIGSLTFDFGSLNRATAKRIAKDSRNSVSDAGISISNIIYNASENFVWIEFNGKGISWEEVPENLTYSLPSWTKLESQEYNFPSWVNYSDNLYYTKDEQFIFAIKTASGRYFSDPDPIIIYAGEDLKLLKKLTFPEEPEYYDFNLGKQLIAQSNDEVYSVYNAKTKNYSIQGKFRDDVEALTLSPDASKIAIATDEYLEVRDISTNSILFSISTDDDIEHIVFFGNGNMLGYYVDEVFYFYDMDKKETVKNIQLEFDFISVSPDGKYFTVYEDREDYGYIYDAVSFNLYKRINIENKYNPKNKYRKNPFWFSKNSKYLHVEKNKFFDLENKKFTYLSKNSEIELIFSLDQQTAYHQIDGKIIFYDILGLADSVSEVPNIKVLEPEVSENQTPKDKTLEEKILELSTLKDKGLLTEEEYNKSKADLLKNFIDGKK